MSSTEVQDFLTPALIERLHGRTRLLLEMYEGKRPGKSRREVEKLLAIGQNMARARSGSLLKVLDYGANELHRLNEAQKAAFRANEQDVDYENHKEYSEYSQWREAYNVVDEQRSGVDLTIFRWIFAAIAEVTAC